MSEIIKKLKRISDRVESSVFQLDFSEDDLCPHDEMVQPIPAKGKNQTFKSRGDNRNKIS